VVAVTDVTAPDGLAGWAVRYATSGLAVLPLHSIRSGRCTCGRDCTSPGKHPLTRNGKNDATTDLTQVTTWWDRWPWANVGIRPPAGVIVLDVDPRNGGAVALRELCRTHAPLPQTLTARTGSGGLHLWLAYAGRARGQLCRGVDVKTESGYVVVPPSLHASGRRYEWLVGLPTARAPRWVRRLLNPLPPLQLALPRLATGGKIDHLVRFVVSAPDGELNNRLYWAAARAHEAGLDTTPLVDAAVAKGHPERGARATATSAARAPVRLTGVPR
jgi:hypothetical protein